MQALATFWVGKLVAVLVCLFGWLIDLFMKFGLVAWSFVAMLIKVGVFTNIMMAHDNNAEVTFAPEPLQTSF